jgi:hypothetical protein
VTLTLYDNLWRWWGCLTHRESPSASVNRSSRGNVFSWPVGVRLFLHVVMRGHATREIAQVNFKTTTPDARIWAVFDSNWSSRSGGQFVSEGYRAIAGETLGYFHQRVLEVHGPETPVHAMGTSTTNRFDNFACSARAKHRQRAKVTAAREERLCGI